MKMTIHYRVENPIEAGKLRDINLSEWKREHILKHGDWRGPVSFWSTREDGFGWDRVIEIHTEYKIQPEGWPEETIAKAGGYVTDYWEIVPADCGPISHTPREHVFSCPNQAEAQRQLERLQEAQRRAKHVLAIIELRALNIKAADDCAAIVQRALLHPAA
jgi:hypothetical protein